MIAYIFWHAAPDGFSLETYEATLLKFGTSLANARISGVLGNASYAVSHTPWLGQGGYEDWTLLDGSSVLDRLNDQATTGCMEESHHAIAQITKHGGLGALYRLVDGAPDLSNDSAIIWLSRPRGVKWREALASICGGARQSLTVWRRQMVLGPAKEFAIVGPPDLALDIPQGWESFTVRRRWLGPR